MKLNLKLNSLLKDKNVLYVTLFIAIANLFGFLMLRQMDAIVFFLIVGFLTSYFSKNMIIIMLVAILSTNFLIGTKLLGKVIKEGFKTGDADATATAAAPAAAATATSAPSTAAPAPAMPAPAMPASADKKKEEICYDPKDHTKVITCPSKSGFTTLSPASIHEGEDVDHKVDYASTLESAYDNLDKLLGSEAIRTMTQDTQRLAEKQQVLMGNIKQLQPMMQNAGKMLDGLNMGQMGDMLTNLENKFKKFAGAKPVGK
jgi:hypothetical protein